MEILAYYLQLQENKKYGMKIHETSTVNDIKNRNLILGLLFDGIGMFYNSAA